MAWFTDFLLTYLWDIQLLDRGNLLLSFFLKFFIDVVFIAILLLISIFELSRLIISLKDWLLLPRYKSKLLAVANDWSTDACCCCRMNLDEGITDHLLRFASYVSQLLLVKPLSHSMATWRCENVRSIGEALGEETVQISLLLLLIHFFHLFLVCIWQLLHEKGWLLLFWSEQWCILFTELDRLRTNWDLTFGWKRMKHCISLAWGSLLGL